MVAVLLFSLLLFLAAGSYWLKSQYRSWQLLPFTFKLMLGLGSLLALSLFQVGAIQYMSAQDPAVVQFSSTIFCLLMSVAIFSRFRAA